MQYYYDTKTNNIYVDIIHGKDIPSDAMTISDFQYKGIIKARSEGKIVEFRNGTFRFKDKPKVYPDIPPIEEVEEALREVRTMRLVASDWTQLSDSPLLDNVDVKQYRQALRDISAADGFPYCDLPLPPNLLARE